MTQKTNIGIEHCWSILCKSTMLDTETNDLSIMGVVDRVHFQVPKEMMKKSEEEKSKGFLIPIGLEIVSKFKKVNKNKSFAFDHRFRLLNPEGEQLGIIEGGRLAMDEKANSMRVRGKIPSLLVEKKNKGGDYEIAVEVKDVADNDYIEVNRIPIEVQWSEAGNGK